MMNINTIYKNVCVSLSLYIYIYTRSPGSALLPFFGERSPTKIHYIFFFIHIYIYTYIYIYIYMYIYIYNEQCVSDHTNTHIYIYTYRPRELARWSASSLPATSCWRPPRRRTWSAWAAPWIGPRTPTRPAAATTATRREMEPPGYGPQVLVHVPFARASHLGYLVLTHSHVGSVSSRFWGFSVVKGRGCG